MTGSRSSAATSRRPSVCDELKRSLALMRPAQAVEHLQQVFAIRGGSGSDGILAIEISELSATATTHQLEPVRPAEPFAGLPDQSPVPLADAIGRGLHRAGDAAEGAKGAFGRALLVLLSWVLAFVPRRRPEYPRTIPRTAEREQGRRRRVGAVGMVARGRRSSRWASTWPPCHPCRRPTPSRGRRSPAPRSPRPPSSCTPSRSAWTAPTSSTATRSRRRSSSRTPTPPLERAATAGVPATELRSLRRAHRAAARRALPRRTHRRTRHGGVAHRCLRGRRAGRHGRRQRRLAVDPRDRARTDRPPRSCRRHHRAHLPRRPGARRRRGPRRPVAHRHRRHRRGRPRPRANGLAHRPRRAHPAPHAAQRDRGDRVGNSAHRRAPASPAARDLQPLRRRRRPPARSTAGARPR